MSNSDALNSQNPFNSTLMEGSSSFYDLLEIAPDASPTEIRSAYLRAKAAYKKDSVALYSLVSEEETEELLNRIEEAYQILSNPEKRRDYDRNHGLLSLDESTLRGPRNHPNPLSRSAPKVVSIDRVPPMDRNSDDPSLLVPPTTDFPSGRMDDSSGAFTSAPGSSNSPFADDSGFGGMAGDSSPALPAYNSNPTVPTPSPVYKSPVDSAYDPNLAQEIATEVEWKGVFLRRVRDSRKVSLEEIADYTKISRTYILAIEEENYAKLPAAVYLRGFVTQIAKFLKLPHDKVAAAYMARFNQVKSAKK